MGGERGGGAYKLQKHKQINTHIQSHTQYTSYKHTGQYAEQSFDPHLLAHLQLPDPAPCENTIEAARALLKAASSADAPANLQYVEFDVQVCGI